MQIMYGLAGERRLTEWEVPWLPGYENSKPVRIGNAAHGQLQLDVYGEVMDALQQARKGGLAATSERLGDAASRCVEHVDRVWDQPDDGIWETRGRRAALHLFQGHGLGGVRPRHQGVEAPGLEGPVDEWRKIARPDPRRSLRQGLRRRRATPSRQRTAARSWMPACCCWPQVGFLPPDDPRFVGTVEAIERELMRRRLRDALRHGRRTNDGLPPGEGAFLACSFWLADAYVSIGRRDDASALFERLLAIRNDLGLLAEEYDPRHGRQHRQLPAGLLAMSR